MEQGNYTPNHLSGMYQVIKKNYLNTSTDDYSHEEVGNNARYSHHEAFYNGDTCIETQHEEEVMSEPGMEMDHEIADCSRDECDHQKKWHCR